MKKEFKQWQTDMHYVIINEVTGNWAQQSYTSDQKSVTILNDHEVRCGRKPCYIEKYCKTEEIIARNNQIAQHYKKSTTFFA